MNSQNYKQDLAKKLPIEEEAVRIAELKKKLYSNTSKVEAVRERGLRQHHIDIGKNWQETDERQAQLRAIEEERVRNAKLGLDNANYMHHGSTLYGHYSLAEEVLSKKGGAIDTSFEKKAPTPPITQESIGSFLSDKFADKRAFDTQKKIAATTVAMKYTSSQLDREIYPHIRKENESPDIKESESSIAENYHPDFTVTTVGKHLLDDVSKEIVHSSNASQIKINDDEVKQVNTEERKRYNFGVIFFIAVCIFFVGAVSYTYVFLSKGTHVVSPDKVQIVVTGPISVKSGEINDFNVDITNGNAVDLTLSDLVVEYPDGTVSPVDKTQLLKNDRIQLGTIKPGETVRSKVSAVFFGEENVKKNIKYAVEFSIPDSSNIFSAIKDIGVVISGSPVTAKIINVQEITNNQELSFDIEIQSNTEEVVKNIQLQVEYPFGYKLTESNLEPAFGNNTWNIGDLAALDTKTIRLKGRLVGTNNLEKNFRFTLGVADAASGEMVSVLSTQDQKVTIEKPFVTTKLSIDGVVQDVKPVAYEDIIKGDIVFTNNLQVPLTDVVVEVSLDGLLIDRTTVQPNNGFYRSSDDVMFWDKAQIDRLASVDPGEAREISFNMSIIESNQNLIQTLRKATAAISITVKAKRLNEKLVPEEVVSIITQELRLETQLGFQGYIAHSVGPFANTGPFPPKVNQETTYTYIGKITNTSNMVKDAVFVAKLPPNVTWKNVYSDTLSTSSVSYSPGRKEIYIKIGDIPPGTGITSSAKEIAFQLGFTPTLTQVGQSPVLISNMRISGKDSFTGRTLERSMNELTISPTGDGDKNIGDGSIIK